MSEEPAAPESIGAPDTSGLAIDLAMEEARNDPSLRAAAAAFLHNQNTLVDLQKHHLHVQLAPALWEKWLGVALRVATALVGLAIAGGLAVMVWNAAGSNRLIVEAFAVPPDLAARGLTGEVVAAKLLDRLNAMQRQTSSSRPPRVTTSEWGEHGIKLEIPESGISLAELDNWLRQKLGHDTHVSGEIVHTDTGLSLTVREGDEGTQTAEGPPAQLDALMQRLSEGLYETVQPYRYGSYLSGHGRIDDAIALLARLAAANDGEDRLWGYSTSLGSLVAINKNLDAGIAMLQDATARNPTYNTWQNLALFQSFRGRPEEALAAFQKSAALSAPQTAALVAGDMGAFRDALPYWQAFAQTPHWGWRDQDAAYYTALSLSGLHETSAAHSLISRLGGTSIPVSMVLIASQAQDWPGVLANGYLTAASVYRSWMPTTAAPYIALAEAKLGRMEAAERRIAATPADCYLCLRMRARIAEVKGDHARADWWFARAVRYGPSVPFAQEDWGRALLDRGKPDDAIEKFAAANQNSSHFADPLEGWGEALMAQNQSHLALAKFAEAEKYAPNWGRLHLKWGEALTYAGKKDEAAKHFARAATLDLTPSEKSELARAVR